MRGDARRAEYVYQQYGRDMETGFWRAVKRGGRYAMALRRSIDHEMREAKPLRRK